MLIRTGDTVEVRSGNSRGTRARVLSVDSASGKLVVEGVNRVYRHIKRSQKNPQGGRLSKEMPIDASNVLLVFARLFCLWESIASRCCSGGRNKKTSLSEVSG